MARERNDLQQLLVLLLTFNSYVVKASIHRSACRRDALFNATDRDKALSKTTGGVLMTVKNVRLSLCAKHCTGHNQCQSLNYKKAVTSECEILSFNKTTTGTVMETRVGWIHYQPIAQTGPRCRLVTCSPGYKCVEACSNLAGYNCLDINECNSSPCQNGATCNNLVNMYTCTCVPGYTGTNCETDINECNSSPCQNGATCNNLVNMYTCTCVPGYTGTNCETDVNECNSTPCQNGATCNNLVNMYTCSCAPGYVGTNCQTDVNECSSSPCQNGGTCNNLVNQYSCTCVSGYIGTNCETQNSECQSYTSLDDATRHINYIDGSYSCDSLTLGWYRFTGSSGTLMYTACPDGYGTKYRCKTRAGGWVQGAHPSTADGIVERTVCFAWSTSCCYLSTTVKIRNCGSFYVYQLQSPPGCYLRYCSY